VTTIPISISRREPAAAARVLRALLLAVFLPLAAPFAGAEPDLKASLGAAFTLPGETTRLTLVVRSGLRPDQPPSAPVVPEVFMRLIKEGLRPFENREQLYVYVFSVRSDTEGVHRIPPLEVSVAGVSYRSQPLELQVSALPEDSWKTLQSGDRNLEYASAIFLPERTPFETETVPVEVRLFIPEEAAPRENRFQTDRTIGVAEIEHDGLLAWRFETSQLSRTSVRLLGRQYAGFAFRSTLSPIRTGTATLGPGEAHLTLSFRLPRRGSFVTESVPATFEVPARSFRVRPLPPGAPPGFDGAVGRFNVSARADTGALEEGDPVSVRLEVSGTGNLDSLRPPRLQAPENEWKVYEPSRLARQGERRDISGSVTFSQIIRPLVPQTEIPPFRLAYFDPVLASYQFSSSKPLPLRLRPSPDPAYPPLPNRSSAPVENMQDILGLVDPARSPLRRPAAARPFAWHLVPALLAAVLLVLVARRRLLPRLEARRLDPGWRDGLARVAQAGNDECAFLRAAGRLVESRIPEDRREPGLERLLERRDKECFRPAEPRKQIDPVTRKSILAALRRSARAARRLVVALALLALCNPPARALDQSRRLSLYQQAEAAWSEGSWRAAIEFYRAAHPGRDLPADVLYNIGNCYFRLREPGRAALHYHRALHADPRHPEARQNLRYLTRIFGPISVERPAYQRWLAAVDRSLFTEALFAAGWLGFLSVLALGAFATRRLRLVAWIALGLGSFTALAVGAARFLYPDDAEFAPADSRAVVVTAEPVTARTEAGNVPLTREEPAPVITAPPGSICRVLARRGPWTYVEFANQTRGWLAAHELETITPASQPSHHLGAL